MTPVAALTARLGGTYCTRMSGSTITTFRDVIERWPSLAAFARDIGVEEGTAKQWRSRSKIPAEYWSDIIVAAQERQIQAVTASLLCSLANRRRDVRRHYSVRRSVGGGDQA